MLSSAAPLLLAIDTSTDTAGIGLADGPVCAELVWPAGRTQTTSVLDAIDALLVRCGRTIADVGAVGVAVGPGTFTGLRVGLSLAKGFALGRDVSVIGVPTLAVTSAPFVEAGNEVLAVLPAGRGRVVCAAHAPGAEPGPPRNMAFDEFLHEAGDRGVLVAGELSAEQRDALVQSGIPVATGAASVRRPAVLAELAMRRWRSGDIDDPATLEPIYVHGVTATTKPVVDVLRHSS